MVTLRPTSLAGDRWLASSDLSERRAARAELSSWVRQRRWTPDDVVHLTVVDAEAGAREWVAVARPPLRLDPPTPASLRRAA